MEQMNPGSSTRLPLVRMSNISKSFSGFKANDSIDLDVLPGEVHSLLGENGAGKTTLVNILSGIYKPESGGIYFNGARTDLRSPKDAILSGIGMVHQHFMLVPGQTVWENMILGLSDLPHVLPRKQIIQKITELSIHYGLSVDPLARIWQLSIGEQQRVAILKMLFRDARVLILDEPTAVLTPQETKGLFDTVRQMKSEGHGIIFISHKLDEVMALSDRVTILRKGKKIGTVQTSDVTKERLAEMMVGEKINFCIEKSRLPSGPIVLKAERLSVRNDRGIESVRGLSLTMKESEILGIAGVAGNGQTELCEALAGLRVLESGKIIMKEKVLSKANPKTFISAGIRYIPADRKGTGLIPNMDINENSILKKYWQEPVSKGFTINWKMVLQFAKDIVNKFNVSTPSMQTPVRNLSGGNLQKLMLGRELSDRPSLIIAVHPTWGLDVASTNFVREALLREREKGAAILLVSEDLDELMCLSDRLAVIHHGKFMGILDEPSDATPESIGLMMAGTPAEPGKEVLG